MAEELAVLAETTLSGSACILLLLASEPLLSQKFSPRWRYWAWLILGLALLRPGLWQVTEVLIPAPIQLWVPQVVEDNAYDRYSAYYQDREAVGQLQLDATSRDGILRSGRLERTWTDHYIVYDDVEMREVEIKDNDFLRAVTVGRRPPTPSTGPAWPWGRITPPCSSASSWSWCAATGAGDGCSGAAARRTRTTGRPWRRPGGG